jgi:AraC-like DNA-binding protein
MRNVFADRERPFSGRIGEVRSGLHQLVWWDGGNDEALVRGREEIRRDERGTAEILMPVAGAITIAHSTGELDLRPGDVVFLPLDVPFRYWHGEGVAAMSVIVPLGAVANRSPQAADRASIFDGRQGLGRVARDLAVSTHGQREVLTPAELDAVCERLIDLACLATAGVREGSVNAHHADSVASARQFVREHAQERDLDGRAIAHALGWSLRYVQAILREEGPTPRELIRRERLALARQRLRSAEYATCSIGTIAFSCGFGSHSEFSSAFRAEVGVSPRELRSPTTVRC